MPLTKWRAVLWIGECGMTSKADTDIVHQRTVTARQGLRLAPERAGMAAAFPGAV